MNRLLFTPAMVVLMALTLTFSSWAAAPAADATGMVANPTGAFTLGSKNHGDAMPPHVVMDVHFLDTYVVYPDVALYPHHGSYTGDRRHRDGLIHRVSMTGHSSGTPGASTDMVLIPKGEFTMGSKNHSDEMTHQVVLDGYYIDKYEVSNAQYRDFMKATDHPAPAYWDDPRLNKAGQPVVGVNWYDATAYCKWTGKRLPTEAEWERAAKGPDGTHFPWGHGVDPTKANYGQNVGKTMPVDSYPNGVSEFGVYNMAGNVFEWVSDWYDPNYFRTSAAYNPQGPADGYNFANQGPVKVLKGGSWLAPQTSLHTSHRFWNQPENNSYGVGLGFRCATSANTKGGDMVKYDYMHALISMGKEQWGDALKSIERAIEHDPYNMEYQQTLDIILKQIKM